MLLPGEGITFFLSITECLLHIYFAEVYSVMPYQLVTVLRGAIKHINGRPTGPEGARRASPNQGTARRAPTSGL